MPTEPSIALCMISLSATASREIFCFCIFPFDSARDDRSVVENHSWEETIAEVHHGVENT